MLKILLVGGVGSFGVWHMMLGVDAVFVAWKSANWPSTPVTIAMSEVETSKSTTRHSSSSSYRPYITYDYTVNGKICSSSEIAPGRIWGSGSADAIVKEFPPGRQTRVFYSPTYPEEGVLLPGLHAYNFGKLAFGTIFLTLACLFGAVFSRMTRDKNAEEDPSYVKSKLAARILPILGVAVLLEIAVTIWLASI